MPQPSSQSSGATARGNSQLTRRSGRPRRRDSQSFLDKKVSLREIGQVANTALQVGKQALSLVNAEKKFLYAAQTDAPGTTAVVTPITIMAAGDGASDRDGLSVRFKALDLRWAISAGAALTDDDQDFVRILIVRQVVSNGIALGAGQIFHVPNDFNSPLSWVYRRQFKVLYDETVSIDAFNRSSSGSVHIPLDNVSTWDSTGSGIADTSSGVYYVVTLAQENTAVSSILWQTMVYFYDN